MAMSDTNAPSSLLSSCIACKAKCCKGKQVTVTEIGYQKIMDAGHPDYFHKTDIQEGTFYVLDHVFGNDGNVKQDGACPYMQDNKCTIEDVKPDTCAAYPMVRKIDYTGWVKEFGITPDCPAAALAANLPAFKTHTLELIQKINEEMPPLLTDKILTEHKNNVRAKLAIRRQEALDNSKEVTQSVPVAALAPAITSPSLNSSAP